MIKSDRAIQNFINSFPTDIKDEGEKIFKKKQIIQIFGNDTFIQGKVKDNEQIHQIVIKKKDYRWHGTSTSKNGSLCPTIPALMFERISRGEELPFSPNEVKGKNINNIIELDLKRKLKTSEKSFIEKLEDRYRRFEIENKIFDYDIVRIHPKWEVQSYEPLNLWPIPPNNIIEFWNFIAYNFFKKNLTFPSFLNTITDLNHVEKIFKKWDDERELKKWTESIDNIVKNQEFRNNTTLNLRIIINSLNARIQIKNSKDDQEDITFYKDRSNQIIISNKYKFIKSYNEIEYLDELLHNNKIFFDQNSSLLWQLINQCLLRDKKNIIRLDDIENGKIFNRIFQNKIFEEQVLGIDEQKFIHADFELIWKCEYKEIDKKNHSKNQYDLKLFTTTKEQVHYNLLCLPGEHNLYILDNYILKGPSTIREKTRVSPEYSIPAKAIENNSGITFLKKINTNIPKNLKDRVENLKMVVSLECSILDNVQGFESEQFAVKVISKDKNNKYSEIYQDFSWNINEEFTTIDTSNENNKTLYYFDKKDYYNVYDVLRLFSLTYHDKLEIYKTRVTSNFPEQFTKWVEKLPNFFELKFDKKLQSLLDDPIKADIKLDIDEVETDWYDIQLNLNTGKLDLSEKEIKKHLLAHGDYVRQKDGKWMRLRIDIKKEHEEALNLLCIDPYTYQNQQHKLHVLQLYIPKASGLFDKKIWDKICKRAQMLKKSPQLEIPKNLNASLREYQVEGFQFLTYLTANGFGGILADDMGLGKTLQSITWLLWIFQKHNKQDNPALVVCPKTVLDVWAMELKKFAPDINFTVIRDKKDFNLDLANKKNCVIILNYAQLRILEASLNKIKWCAVILDEGQQIKNPDSKSSKAAYTINSKNKLVLTGTPIENRPLDIWSLMTFAMPGTLGSRAFFTKNFDKRKHPDSSVNIASRLRPFLLRRTKDQVLKDLPQRTEEDILCNLNKEQRVIYEKYLNEIQTSLAHVEDDESVNKSSFIVIQGLLRLRQICCHPALVNPENMNAGSAKLDALFYHLNQLVAEGHKVLVFSQFVKMLEIIRTNLEKEKMKYFYLTGQTVNRRQIVDEFQNSTDPSVFLLSLKAGGSGLNLTAASYVVLFDPWWNPAVEAQAIDRTHRIGQKNPVFAYRLLSQNTIEDKIRKLQKEKQTISSEILGYESFAKNLTLKDLRFLFSIDKSNK